VQDGAEAFGTHPLVASARGEAVMMTLVSWFFGLILGVDALFLCLLIVAWLEDLREVKHIPPDFLEKFSTTVKQRRYRDAFELARNNHSMMALSLMVGMARLQFSLESAIEESAKAVESRIDKKRHGINYLMVAATVGSTVVVVGPILGWHVLLGTPLGGGLTVPAIMFREIFLRRLSAIANDVNLIARDLLREMYHQDNPK